MTQGAASSVDFATTRSILRFEGADRTAYWRRFAALLGLSVVIATMGLLRNSSAVIIAAMLIAPLMTPILGIAAAVVMGWNGRALRLLSIVLLAALMSIGLAWGLLFLADIPPALRLPEEIRGRTDPGVEDLVVALAAGAAGAYVQINRREISLLPGAAIGVALVPPLAASGILFHYGKPVLAREAALLFGTNLAAIVLAASAVYVAYSRQAVLKKARKRLARFSLGFIATLIVLAAIGIQLTAETLDRYRDTRLEAGVGGVIRDWSGDVPVEMLRVDVNGDRRWAEIWLIVDLPMSSQQTIASPASMIPEELDGDILVRDLRRLLGPGYTIGFRYQTRIAAAVTLVDGDVDEAPPVEDDDAE